MRQVLEHLPEYSSVTAAAEVVGRREGLGKEKERRWVIQAQIDGGQRQGATSEELAEIKELKAKVRRLEEDNEMLRRAAISLAVNSTPAIGDRDHTREAGEPISRPGEARDRQGHGNQLDSPTLVGTSLAGDPAKLSRGTREHDRCRKSTGCGGGPYPTLSFIKTSTGSIAVF